MTDRNSFEPQVVADGMAFLEGPRWHHGALWFSDFFTHHVFRLVPGLAPEVVCDVPGQPSGLGFDAEDRLLVVSMTERRVLRLDGGELVEHADLSDLASGDLNDMIVAPDGGAWVGNVGRNAGFDEPVVPTRLIRVDPDGSARQVGEELVFPNGSAIADGGSTLLVAESFAARISAFSIEPDGDLSEHSTWAQLGPVPATPSLAAALRADGPVPDGIALDLEGALWIADASGGALRVSRGGETLDRLDLPGLCVFALALGGADRRTLYLCAAPSLKHYRPTEERQGRLIATEVGVPGLAEDA